MLKSEKKTIFSKLNEDLEHVSYKAEAEYILHQLSVFLRLKHQKYFSSKIA